MGKISARIGSLWETAMLMDSGCAVGTLLFGHLLNNLFATLVAILRGATTVRTLKVG